MSSVAVVIPCYNQGAFLEEALASVRVQTRPPEELIVVDDGSDDPETLRVLEGLSSSVDLRLIRQENAGPAAARNAGIRAASAEMIVCLDGDDRLRPVFLERTIPLLEADSDTGIAYGRAEFFGAAEGEAAHPPFCMPDFLLDPCIYATALFRRADWEAVGGFCEEMREGWEDFEFWVSLVGLGREVAFVDEVVFDYRRHDRSRDHAFSESRERILAAFETIYRRHSDLYARNIRVLFEAHLERLDLRALFPTGGRAELRLSGPSGETLVRAEDPVGGTGAVVARFPLVPGDSSRGRFRLDPFDGPGAFRLEQIVWRRSADDRAEPLPTDSFQLDGHSLGVRTSDEEGEEVFFLGPDPQVWFHWSQPPLLERGGVLEFHYTVRRGPRVAGEFLVHLGQADARFDALREEIASLRLELEHVKGELATEMERRRAIQRSRAYRWTRWLRKPSKS